jgi:hypothetical protein
VRKAAGRARAVKVYTYGGRAAALWWSQNRAALERLDNLSVIDIPEGATATVTALAARNMRLDCTIQEGELWLWSCRSHQSGSCGLSNPWMGRPAPGSRSNAPSASARAICCSMWDCQDAPGGLRSAIDSLLFRRGNARYPGAASRRLAPLLPRGYSVHDPPRRS